jgi:hypothetical protein
METFSTIELFKFECHNPPSPPGTKGTPRPADRPREIIEADDANPPISPAVHLPSNQLPENTVGADD